MSYLGTWGWLAYEKIPNPKWVKLTSRFFDLVFIMYAINTKLYIFYDLNAKVIIKSNNVDFHNTKLFFK